MISEALRILIRDHYISRLWSWIAGYGILLAILGVTVIYEQSGVLNPMRYMFGYQILNWISYGIYGLSVLGVALSFLLGLRLKPDRLSIEADRADLNPGVSVIETGFSEVEQRAQIILWRLFRIESIEWNAASWPGFLGIIWYVLVGSTRGLIVYMAISAVAMLFHRPSLAYTEKLVEDYVRRRSTPFIERDSS